MSNIVTIPIDWSGNVARFTDDQADNKIAAKGVQAKVDGVFYRVIGFLHDRDPRFVHTEPILFRNNEDVLRDSIMLCSGMENCVGFAAELVCLLEPPAESKVNDV